MTYVRAGNSYFDRIGGIDVVRSAVDRLYALILSDPDLMPYFDGVNMSKQRGHMAAMLTKALGGPDEYAGRTLSMSHLPLGITKEHYERVCAYVMTVFTNLGVDSDIVSSISMTLASAESQIVSG